MSEITDEIDHEHTDEITCPYCGWTDMDSWEAIVYKEGNPDDLGTIECPACQRSFTAEREITITYTTYKMKETE